MTEVLVIQRGHVARTTGATGAPAEQAMAIRNAAEVLLIASELPDVTPSIIDADEQNARYRGEAFIAFHGDAAASSKAGGASVGYRNSEGRLLGQRWKEFYGEGGWIGTFRGDNYTANLARYYGTGQAVSAGNSKAIIVEHGFMTNPTEREFIESDKGVKLAACAAIAAAHPQYDLDRLLKGAPKPPVVKDTKPPASTTPSDTVITFGDRGQDVRAWQQDLIRAGFPIPAGATGNFLEQTRDATNAFYRQVGLTSRDPNRPIVGPRSYTAMEKLLASQKAAPAPVAWQGKSVYSKVDGLRIYGQPGWHPSVREVATFDKGWRFPRIEARIRVGSGWQYRVRNSRGIGPYYVTASRKYVDVR